MRVAIVHDWLTGMRGGERVLEALLELVPDAHIFTLVHQPGSVSRRIEDRPIQASFLDRLPGARRRYRNLLPLFPLAVSRFDLRGYDLVLSTSHCVAHGAPVPPGIPHISYCHAPMRYVWDRYQDYFAPDRAGRPTRMAMRLLAPRLRRWDAAAARRPGTTYLASSRDVRERIRRCWGREAAVVHPPVEVGRFAPAPRREDFYLIVSALVPYKRIDLAVSAFRGLDRELVIAGTGPELSRLRLAAPPNVMVLGWVADNEVAELMGRCRAFIMPAHEDFGITAVEAQAAGAPVIAYGEGGALDTVVPAGTGPKTGQRPGATGLFFREQTVEALAAAVQRFERLEFDPAALRAQAMRFDRGRFLEAVQPYLGLGEKARAADPMASALASVRTGTEGSR